METTTAYIFRVSRQDYEMNYILQLDSHHSLPEGIYEGGVPNFVAELCDLLGVDPEQDPGDYFEIVKPDGEHTVNLVVGNKNTPTTIK